MFLAYYFVALHLMSGHPTQLLSLSEDSVSDPIYILIKLTGVLIKLTPVLLRGLYLILIYVGEPRLELGTSASKADVLTNYTAFPNINNIYTVPRPPAYIS